MKKPRQPDSEIKSPLLSVQQAAAYLGMSISWTYDHAADLGGSRLGGRIKFPLVELQAYVERQRITEPEPVPVPITRPVTRQVAPYGAGRLNPLDGQPYGSVNR